MRIESVYITAFGPFKDRTLTFSPRMTVVHGPNEAGKSTWHSAIYAALCGIRRATGKRKEDKEFEERYRPWDSKGWRVGAHILLADGRRVKIDQELVHRVDCSAQLLDAEGLEACDLSQEIINEGTPDVSRWLGLDRRSFLSTACVRQAELPSIAEGSKELQVQLQRAAATGGADATAAAALQTIDDFLNENVGLDRANSTRPLRRAKQRLTKARDALERANEEHADYLRLVVATEDARSARDTARLRVKQAEGGPPPDTSAEASLAKQAVKPSGNVDSLATTASNFESARQRQQIHREAAPAGTSPEQVSPFTPPIILAGVFLLGAAGFAFARRLDLAVGAVIVAVALGGLALLRRSQPGREAVLQEVRSHELTRWRERDDAHAAAVEDAARNLQLALDERSAPPGDDAAQRLEAYQAACEDRSRAQAAGLAATRREFEAASAAVAQLEGALGERAEHVPDVAEAEEELASAQAEQTRVEDLSLLLEQASGFLRDAQERVHHDVAPILANDVRANLSAVTGGRYTDVKVDPQTLRVEVRSSDGQWRDAGQLSYGTTEQVYLLLRIAVVNLLTGSTETCPLLVDDITAQWDTDRTVAVLNLLHRLSEQRQVVVFSQEIDVMGWALVHLADEPNGLIRLAPPRRSAQ